MPATIVPKAREENGATEHWILRGYFLEFGWEISLAGIFALISARPQKTLSGK